MVRTPRATITNLLLLHLSKANPPPSTNRYQARLARRPLLTQAVTTFVLFGAGDVIAQQAVDKKGIEKHDLARTGRMALYGGGEFFPLSPTGQPQPQRPQN